MLYVNTVAVTTAMEFSAPDFGGARGDRSSIACYKEVK